MILDMYIAGSAVKVLPPRITRKRSKSTTPVDPMTDYLVEKRELDERRMKLEFDDRREERDIRREELQIKREELELQRRKMEIDAANQQKQWELLCSRAEK